MILDKQIISVETVNHIGEFKLESLVIENKEILLEAWNEFFSC